jgi:hypothetical protein
MLAQTKMYEEPKDKRDIRRVVMLNSAEMQSVKEGMERLGESNVSNYIRRLIQDERLRTSRSR